MVYMYSYSTPVRRVPVDNEKVGLATRGFAELELGPSKPTTNNKQTSSSSTTSTTTTTTTTTTTKSDEWSVDEQRRLEEALIKHPGSVGDKARWKAIANDVGRSARQCVARYRQCATMLATTRQ
jgi:hypothetical protein